MHDHTDVYWENFQCFTRCMISPCASQYLCILGVSRSAHMNITPSPTWSKGSFSNLVSFVCTSVAALLLRWTCASFLCILQHAGMSIRVILSSWTIVQVLTTIRKFSQNDSTVFSSPNVLQYFLSMLCSRWFLCKVLTDHLVNTSTGASMDWTRRISPPHILCYWHGTKCIHATSVLPHLT